MAEPVPIGNIGRPDAAFNWSHDYVYDPVLGRCPHRGRRSGAEKARAAQGEIIQAFLKRGVSPALKDAKGKSVLEWVKSDWIREMLANTPDVS